MRKKNNYVSESLSFEEFEQVTAQRSEPLDELVKERLSAEKESRQKECELKKAKRKAKA